MAIGPGDQNALTKFFCGRLYGWLRKHRFNFLAIH